MTEKDKISVIKELKNVISLIENGRIESVLCVFLGNNIMGNLLHVPSEGVLKLLGAIEIAKHAVSIKFINNDLMPTRSENEKNH